MRKQHLGKINNNYNNLKEMEIKLISKREIKKENDIMQLMQKSTN